MNSADAYFLEKAFSLAAQADRGCLPNPHVGAVLVKDNTIVAEGFHRKAGGEHAEASVLRQAGVGARGATLYCTLEPCSHTGSGKRTPPCAQSIVAAGVARVVVGAVDPNPHQRGAGLRVLRGAGVRVSECDYNAYFTRQNEEYVCGMRNRRPLITLKWAETADGFSADYTGNSQWISDDGALDFAHALRGVHSAVLVGSGTAVTDNPSLTVRRGPAVRRGKQTVQPVRVVVDSGLRVPETSKLFQVPRSKRDAAPAVIAVYASDTGDTETAARAARLEAAGVTTLGVPRAPVNQSGGSGHLDLAAMFSELYSRYNITSVLVEGGAVLHRALIDAGLWDKITVVIAPRLLCGGKSLGGGDGSGTGASAGPGALPMSKILDIRLPYWFSLDHYKSKCIALRGYRDIPDSLRQAEETYTGAWYV